MSDLIIAEQQELFERETRIEAAQETVNRSWVLIGEELHAIRERRLYRHTHSTFENYCEQRWGFSDRRARQLIEAEGVVRNLEQPTFEDTETGNAFPVFHQPSSDVHVRPLVNLEPEQQRQAWKEVEATAPEGKITERHVKETVQKLFWPQAPIAPEPEDQRCEQLIKQLYSDSVLIGDIRRTMAFRQWPIEETAQLAERIELMISLLQDTLEDVRKELDKGLHVVKGA